MFYTVETKSMSLITKQAVREQTEHNIGSAVYEELEDEVKELIQKAVERAEANGRRTVKARDV